MKSIQYSWIGRFNVVKMILIPKAMYNSMQSLSKSQECFCRNRKKYPEIYMESQRTLKNKTVLEKKKDGELTPPDFKTH